MFNLNNCLWAGQSLLLFPSKSDGSWDFDKHLPEIPSTMEIEENEGVNEGEMQVKLRAKSKRPHLQ